MNIQLIPGKKIYFASDFHLGAPSESLSKEREQKIIRWLNIARQDAQHIFLMGDIFDFWFEYRTVVPKGYVRFLGKIAQLLDEGIGISFFTGNHDIWMFDYFPKELGIQVFRHPQEVSISGLSFHLAHGDGLGPGDVTYKQLKHIFTNPFCQWLFTFLPPGIGIGFARRWSAHSRKKGKKSEGLFYGEKESLWQYCLAEEQKMHRDFYLMGHRHFPMVLPVGENSHYFNLGEWVSRYTYATFDGTKVQLMTFADDQPALFTDLPGTYPLG